MGYLPIAYVAMVSVPVAVLLHTPPIGAVHIWVNTCGVTVHSALGFSFSMAVLIWWTLYGVTCVVSFIQRGAQLHVAVGAYDVVHLCITRLGLAYCTYVRNRQQLFRHNGYMYHHVSPCDTSATYVYSMYITLSLVSRTLSRCTTATIHEEAKWRKRSVPKTGESMLGMQDPTDLRRSFISLMGSFDRNWW